MYVCLQFVYLKDAFSPSLDEKLQILYEVSASSKWLPTIRYVPVRILQKRLKCLRHASRHETGLRRRQQAGRKLRLHAGVGLIGPT